jgi:NADH pyrophosphatase NudC (nudix superfamily)
MMFSPVALVSFSKVAALTADAASEARWAAFRRAEMEARERLYAALHAAHAAYAKRARCRYCGRDPKAGDESCAGCGAPVRRA